jgi:hypothetical protein
LKQRGSRFPRVRNDRLRLREHIETPDSSLTFIWIDPS